MVCNLITGYAAFGYVERTRPLIDAIKGKIATYRWFQGTTGNRVKRVTTIESVISDTCHAVWNAHRNQTATAGKFVTYYVIDSFNKNQKKRLIEFNGG